MAVASGTTLRGPGGELLTLTPVASWTSKALDPAALASPPGKDSEAAADPAATPASACLTPQGKLESNTDSLLALLGERPRLTPTRQLLFTVLPPPGRSYSCLLVSTNTPALLQTNPASQRLWMDLSRAVRWPLPPGH